MYTHRKKIPSDHTDRRRRTTVRRGAATLGPLVGMVLEDAPLAPSSVEAMRAAAGLREATIISVLAVRGAAAGELRELRWRQVRERTLLIDAAKTGRRRTVRLLLALAADLALWRSACGDVLDGLPVFPAERGGVWSAKGFEKWRRRRFKFLLGAADLSSGRPYDLRHSFASLLCTRAATLSTSRASSGTAPSSPCGPTGT
jgi:integrase